jgi:hypothetical protein
MKHAEKCLGLVYRFSVLALHMNQEPVKNIRETPGEISQY